MPFFTFCNLNANQFSMRTLKMLQVNNLKIKMMVICILIEPKIEFQFKPNFKNKLDIRKKKWDYLNQHHLQLR